MKKNKLIGQIFAIAIILILLATGLPFSGSLSVTVPVVSADNSSSVSKISSLLSLRIMMKTRYLAQAGNMPQGQVALPGADIQASGDLTQLNHEKVFLHFMQRPTTANLSELAALGVTAYPDSWIPPVGSHPTGFILADMPVDKLDALAAKDYIVNLNTAEKTAYPQNDVARTTMGVASVWSGGDTGAGVTVAVLDSGIDTSNPDFPPLNTSNSKDYSNYPTLDDTITNTVTGHGTHVTGSVLGRGVNSATYKGVAPGANLVFLKIGSDSTGRSSDAVEAAAIRAAVDTYHADIITMSYVGWSDAHDGSDEQSQAVDYAVSQGATVFISAGNDGALGWHYSGTVAPNSTTGFIRLNFTGGSGANTGLAFNLVWYDGLGTHNGLSLKYYNSLYTELTTVTAGAQSESSKGTENVYSFYNYYVGSGTYYLKVQNASGSSQAFHIYYNSEFNSAYSANVQFASADPNYTISSPAEADGAIAVGAYVSRKSWTDYQGSGWTYTVDTVGSIATFSSRGPRVDSGAPGKPDIVAPGKGIISVRDNTVYPWPTYNTSADIYPYYTRIIDNNGLNQNGSGPADYLIMEGTSMACPLAAGVGALLLSKNPALTPAQVKNALQTTATDKGAAGFDNIYGYGLINASAAVNSITPPTVAFSSATYSAAENAATKTITVNLSKTSVQTITVNYATSNGNATAGSDYTAASGTLTFNPGNTTKTFNVTILDDSIFEGPETVNLALSSPVNATLGSPNTAVLTITDNETQPTVAFSSATYSAAENAGNATITVNLSGASAQTITVNYATSNGNATAGSDYTAVSGMLTFNPGNTTKTFNITILDDSIFEGPETVNLALNSPVKATLGSPSTAVLTITDNEGVPSVAFSSATYSAAENAGNATITVNLSGASTQTITVNYATSNGNATASSDYTAASGTLTFNPGNTTKTFNVTILDDAIFEGPETVNLALSSPGNATLGSPNTAILTITDNEPQPSVAFSSATYSVVENAGTATITVNLSGASAQTVTVTYTTSNGNATAGSDYTAASGTLTFNPGNTTKTFNVTILDDAIFEGPETVNLALSSPGNATLGSPSTAVLTITDNETQPTVAFSSATYSVSENAGTATITVNLSGASVETITVNYATSNGNATVGSDYTAASGTLTFNPGQTSKTFNVTILDDAIFEGPETVNLALSNPGNATLGSPNTAILTITDNEPQPTVAFSSATYSVSENAGTATITVNLSGASAQTVTVNYATSNGNATAGSDYTAASGTLTFNPGNTTQTFNVTILDDAIFEGDETVNLALSSPGNATLGSPGTAVLTITDATPVTGITREVDGNILGGVSITLDGIGSVISDQDGQYAIMATATGNYTVVAHKDGFRDRTQIVNIVGLGQEFAVTCNFQGNLGLIPKAPDIWYALDCVNRWLYPPNPETGLEIWTALDVVNAWLYPIQ